MTAFHPVTNPEPTLLFNPDQTDFLCCRQQNGLFLAIDLNLIESFQGAKEGDEYWTAIQLVNNGGTYTSEESVPVLVARFSEVKARRYSKDRAQREVMAASSPQVAAPAPQASGVPAVKWTVPPSK